MLCSGALYTRHANVSISTPPQHTLPPPLQELYNAIVKNDIKLAYKKIEEGADVNFVFGRAYKCPEGYTPLMVAAHRSRCVC